MPPDIRTITVFGSAHPPSGDPNYEAARRLGGELARRGYRICTGGYGGVMEAASRGAKEAGGRTLGITLKLSRSKANAWVDEERVAESWQARLFELIAAGQAYVACEGGTGTLAELAVVWEMLNKGVIAAKPLVVMGDFWKPVIGCVIQGEADHSSLRGEAARKLIQFAPGAREAMECLTRGLEAGSHGGADATLH